jgi:DNA invertase Pin-like site-specific DNA recombinase
MNATTAPKTQVRAACYCRISSDPNDKREGVDRQREDTTALCEVKGWTPAGFYVDNDRSASNGKARPEWDRLLADIKAGEIDAIAAWDQDRGWRMMHELEQLRKFFTGLGREIPLATTGQGDIDLYSPTGVLMAQMKTAVSEHEIAMMKVRMRRAARQKAEQGRPQWRRAFGYSTDGTYQPDPVTAPLVAEAYRALLAGASISDIARTLNAAGAYGLNGQPWTPSTASLFLRAPRNAGLRAHNDEIVSKGTWPALVDEKTWRTAQTVLNAPGRAPGRKTVSRHLLTGVLGCGKPGCGGYLSGYWDTQKILHYRCKVCRGVAIRAAHVEPLLLDAITGRLVLPDAVDLLKADIHDAAEAEAIRTELNGLHTELRKIGIERGQRLLTGEQAKIATDLINDEIAKLQARQHDQERLRVFADVPLGTPQAAPAIKALTPDRYRAIIAVLATVTVLPVGKGHRVNGERFDPDRVHMHWR